MTDPATSAANPKSTTNQLPDELSRAGMLWIPGSTFRMGSDKHYPEEHPVHRVTVDGFWILPQGNVKM